MTTKLESVLSELTEQNEEKKGSKISVNSSQRFTEIWSLIYLHVVKFQKVLLAII